MGSDGSPPSGAAPMPPSTPITIAAPLTADHWRDLLELGRSSCFALVANRSALLVAVGRCRPTRQFARCSSTIAVCCDTSCALRRRRSGSRRAPAHQRRSHRGAGRRCVRADLGGTRRRARRQARRLHSRPRGARRRAAGVVLRHPRHDESRSTGGRIRSAAIQRAARAGPGVLLRLPRHRFELETGRAPFPARRRGSLDGGHASRDQAGPGCRAVVAVAVGTAVRSRGHLAAAGRFD